METALETRRLDDLAAEINALKAQTAMGIVEIGRRLVEARELHKGDDGGFRQWCTDRCGFGRRTAYNFIRCAEQADSVQTFAHLDISKVYNLLELPEPTRQEIVSQPQTIPSTGEQKAVDDMTTRELAEVVKAKKEAERQATEAAERARRLESQLLQLEETLEVERQKPAKVEYRTPPEVEARLNTLQAELDELQQRKSLTSEYTKRKAELEEQILGLTQSHRRLQEATNEEEIRKARAARYESVFLRAAKPLMESKAELEALSREGVLHWTAVRSLKRNLEVLYELLDMVDDTLKTVESPI